MIWWKSLDGMSKLAVLIEVVAVAFIVYGLGHSLWDVVAP